MTGTDCCDTKIHSNSFSQLSVFKSNSVHSNKNKCLHKFFSPLFLLCPSFLLSLCYVVSPFFSRLLPPSTVLIPLIQQFTNSTNMCFVPSYTRHHLRLMVNTDIENIVLGNLLSLILGMCTCFSLEHNCKSHVQGIKACSRYSKGEIFYSCGAGKQNYLFFYSLVITASLPSTTPLMFESIVTNLYKNTVQFCRFIQNLW